VRRHEPDWISLSAGLVFLGFAVLYLVASLADVSIDGRFVWPVVLVAVGAAGVATAVSANARAERDFKRGDQPDT
jgi:hypothetical protein